MKFEAFNIRAGGFSFIMFRLLSSHFSFSAASSFSQMKLKNDFKSIFKEEISFKDTNKEIND